MSKNSFSKNTTFKELGLSEKLLKAISDVGYSQPTPIQEKTIPSILMTRDIVGIAQTGTGKTGAFTLPMIEMLDGGRLRARMPRSLILTPTRELAMQISEDISNYSKYTNLTYAVLVGGISIEPQIKKLEKGIDILIATPGRLLDLFERGSIMLADIKILVIDEADRMLDMGFIPDIEKIISKLPPLRQTLLFSATMPPAISKLATKFLSNPKEISVSKQSSTTKNVEDFVIGLTLEDKKPALSHILFEEEVTSAFIFCNRKKDIDSLKQTLERQGISGVGALHGDMNQHIRTDVLNNFKNGDIKILVCSDVAARGLDVKDVSHVFNYDTPQNSEDYVHRIGRTGRAGSNGRAFTFVTKDETKYLADIEKLIGGSINRYNIDGFNNIDLSFDFSQFKQANKKHRNSKNKNNRKKYNKKQNIDGGYKQKKYKQSPQIEEKPVKGFGKDVPDFFKF